MILDKKDIPCTERTADGLLADLCDNRGVVKGHERVAACSVRGVI